MGVGGFINICNGTPYNLHKTNEYKYQMSDDKLPNDIPPCKLLQSSKSPTDDILKVLSLGRYCVY